MANKQCCSLQIPTGCKSIQQALRRQQAIKDIRGILPGHCPALSPGGHLLFCSRQFDLLALLLLQTTAHNYVNSFLMISSLQIIIYYHYYYIVSFTLLNQDILVMQFVFTTWSVLYMKFSLRNTNCFLKAFRNIILKMIKEYYSVRN